MAPPPAFDRLYSEQVLPDLRWKARALASWVAYRELSFVEAEAELWAEAWRRGAGRLTDPSGLSDALASFLLERINLAMAERTRAQGMGFFHGG